MKRLFLSTKSQKHKITLKNYIFDYQYFVLFSVFVLQWLIKYFQGIDILLAEPSRTKNLDFHHYSFLKKVIFIPFLYNNCIINVYSMPFEFNILKSEANKEKHGIDFIEAQEIAIYES